MLKPVIVEYWQDMDGGFRAESSAYPIAASGESLFQLKAQIARQIRECFRPGPIPSVYDLIPRANAAHAPNADGGRSLSPDCRS
jgi:hypothetical protein